VKRQRLGGTSHAPTPHDPATTSTASSTPAASTAPIAAPIEPILLTRGDQAFVRIDPILDPGQAPVTEFNATFEARVRGADGAPRAPASASLSIPKGAGSILTLNGMNPPGTGTEIVVLILPRWSSESSKEER
jgi:hypothetical protein